jgi:hypothetical protein
MWAKGLWPSPLQESRQRLVAFGEGPLGPRGRAVRGLSSVSWTQVLNTKKHNPGKPETQETGDPGKALRPPKAPKARFFQLVSLFLFYIHLVGKKTDKSNQMMKRKTPTGKTKRHL